MEAILRSFDYSGKASRKEYWMFFLYYCLTAGLAAILDFSSGLTANLSGFGPFWIISTTLLLIPHVAIIARRLNDLSKSRWWTILLFIPMANLLLFFFLADTTDTPTPQQRAERPRKQNMSSPYSLLPDTDVGTLVTKPHFVWLSVLAAGLGVYFLYEPSEITPKIFNAVSIDCIEAWPTETQVKACIIKKTAQYKKNPNLKYPTWHPWWTF